MAIQQQTLLGKYMAKNYVTDDETAIVCEVLENEVLVEMERKGGCSSCSMNVLCMGGANQKRFKVQTTLKLSKGDAVRLNISPASRLLSSFIVFVVPVLMLIVGYYFVKLILKMPEDAAVFGSLLTMLFSVIILKIADKKFSSKIKVEIVEKIVKEQSDED